MIVPGGGGYDRAEVFGLTETTETFVVPALLPGSSGWSASVSAIGGSGSTEDGANTHMGSFREYLWGPGDVGKTFDFEVGGDGKDPSHGGLGGWPNGGNGGTSSQQGNGHGGGGMTKWKDSDIGDLIAGGTGGAAGIMDPPSGGGPYSATPYDILPPSGGGTWGAYAYGWSHGCNGSTPFFGPGSGGPGGGCEFSRVPYMDPGWFYALTHPGPFNPRLWFDLDPTDTGGGTAVWPDVPASELDNSASGWTEGTLFRTGTEPGMYSHSVPGEDGADYVDGGKGGDGADGNAAPGGGGGGGGLGGGGGGGSSDAATESGVYTNTNVSTYLARGLISLTDGSSVWGFVRWWGPGGAGGRGSPDSPEPGGPWNSGIPYDYLDLGAGGRVAVFLTALYGGEMPNVGWKVGSA